MEEYPSFTFYTYAQADIPVDQRWKQTGIPDIFFDDCQTARRALLDLRNDVTADPDMEWSVMNLERVKTVPISQSSILALLNDGPGSFISSYEIIESIGPKRSAAPA